MLSNLPENIKAEVIANYLEGLPWNVNLHGMHHRNAYEDILGIREENGELQIDLARNGLYDILPEPLFHPIDRFENLPANEYKERFAEEVEKQHKEEQNAREFFRPLDIGIFSLNVLLDKFKQVQYGDNKVLVDIICDRIPEKLKRNRFIQKLLPFVPLASRIRGDRNLLDLLVRKILKDEGLVLVQNDVSAVIKDETPRYCRQLTDEIPENPDVFLGNAFDEDITVFTVRYWSESDCDENFKQFVELLQEFEEFISDFFLALGQKLRFELIHQELPVRLDDEIYFNYLDYNTNL